MSHLPAPEPPEPPEPPPPPAPPDNARAERIVAMAFVVTMITGVALLAVYIAGGQTQVEAVLLFLCLGGLGFGIVIWAHDLLPNRQYIEARHSMERDAVASARLADSIVAERGFTRRTMLLRLLAGALAGLGAALAIPIFSLGPAPGRSLFVTPWKRGLRLVDVNNEPVRADQVPIDSVVTVFPEGSPGSADGQALLIHVEEGLLRLSPDRLGWAPDGFVVYSKVCTHAGCPVGLYRASLHSLICPCHQSTFEVLDGARPVFGPASRPLPQLPISLQSDGTFVALGDFPEPVGPSFWDMTSK